MRGRGLQVQTTLQLGDPVSGILQAAKECSCDLIAMTTHGHGLIGDILRGSTINEVRHRTEIPVLVVRRTK
jgi:manganese transport protein